MVKCLSFSCISILIRHSFIRLMREESVVKEAGSHSEVLWSRLAKLFSTMSMDNPAYESTEAVTKSREKCKSDEYSSVPFEEDFSLRGMKEFDELLVNIKWDSEIDLNDVDKVSSCV